MMTARPTGSRPASHCCLIAIAAVLAWQPALGQSSDLAAGFAAPPQSARPRVWWHWMNGNITKDGIAKDMAWMKRVGIGGLQNFDANLATPTVVDKRLIYMDAGWKDAFRFTAAEAERQGLELAIAASPGWSETGGPWVRPEDGLKKLVWSETVVQGGAPFRGQLAPPPSVTGPFQDLPFQRRGVAAPTGAALPVFYRDIAVLGYPIAASAPVTAPEVFDADGRRLNGVALTDGNLATIMPVAISPDHPARLTQIFAQPRIVRSAIVYVPGGRDVFGRVGVATTIEASDDGRNWRPIAAFDLSQVATTVSFAPVTARQFRLTMQRASRNPDTGRDSAEGLIRSATSGSPAVDPDLLPVAEFRLSDEVRVNQAEAKAGFSLVNDYYALDANADAAARGIDPKTVVDLTNRMKEDGSLDWTPPAGAWRIVRLGSSLLGTTNHPAPPEATGLEVDKFDGAAVRRYIDHYLSMYHDAAGADMIGRRGVRALLTDSIEVGAANWTPRMVEQFRRLRGYDPTPWLLALTGTLIGSRADSDRFLYDYRRTLADLMSSEHYGTIAKAAHEAGLIVYGEALENNRPSLGDDMTMRSHADIPMAAMWTFTREAGGRPTYVADIKGAASVAHIYGQNLVAAESMTSANVAWNHAPADLRRVIDLEFAAGVNRPVVHTSVHQPVDDKVPGFSLSIYGQFFNRHESWAEMAKPWVDYLSRNSFMLQQGRNVADIGYFYGEEAPLTGLYGQNSVADAPTRYAYDFVSADALDDQLSVRNGNMVAEGGAIYRALYLGGSSSRMTLATLRHIARLVEGGGTVIGAAPVASPALADDPAEFRTLVDRLWGPTARIGRGRVIPSQNVEAALATLGSEPDFDYVKPRADSKLLFVHRRTDDADIYYVNSRVNRPERMEARFRVTGKRPQIWRADTGEIRDVSYRTEGGHTVVPLEFGPEDSFFVVFRERATAPTVSLPRAAPRQLATLAGPWMVRFQPGRGAPSEVRLPSLAPLNEQANPAIRYFSGETTYSRSFELPRGAAPGKTLMLDLGRVGDLAEVRVNGVNVGTAWHAPYRLDIGKALRPGTNMLEIKVANLWVNRLIGDAQPGAKPITWTAIPTYRADAPLRAAGLIGPVALLAER